MGFVIILPLVITVNILWYWLKFDLKKHGFETHLFCGHFTDLVNVVRVIRNADDKSVKKVYSGVLGCIIAMTICVVMTAFNAFSSIGNSRCRVFDRYLSHSYSGQVKQKFIDRNNHAIESLILINSSKESTISMNLDLQLYEFVKPGDMVVKQANDSTILVSRGSKTFEYSRKRSEFCR